MELQRLDLTDRAVAGAVLAVQRRAYRVEADLVGFDAIPPLHETLADLQASTETFLAANVDGQLAGLVRGSGPATRSICTASRSIRASSGPGSVARSYARPRPQRETPAG